MAGLFGFTVDFDAVTHDTNGNLLAVAYYEIEIEKLDDEPILQSFDVILRPSQTSVAVPAAFLEPLTAYKFEVIAVIEGGNRTITESGTFTTNRRRAAAPAVARRRAPRRDRDRESRSRRERP